MSSKVQIPSNVTLEVIEGVDKGSMFTISNKTITIGRESVCNIILADKYVSKKHCQIVFRRDHFTAIDLGSLNKTKVNNNIYVQKNLKDDDIITLGKTKLQFHWEEQDDKKIDELEDIPGIEDEEDAECIDAEAIDADN